MENQWPVRRLTGLIPTTEVPMDHPQTDNVVSLFGSQETSQEDPTPTKDQLLEDMMFLLCEFRTTAVWKQSAEGEFEDLIDQVKDMNIQYDLVLKGDRAE